MLKDRNVESLKQHFELEKENVCGGAGECASSMIVGFVQNDHDTGRLVNRGCDIRNLQGMQYLELTGEVKCKETEACYDLLFR